jgi:hypothetical protein
MNVDFVLEKRVASSLFGLQVAKTFSSLDENFTAIIFRTHENHSFGCFVVTMSAKYHALANASAVVQRKVPKGARSWSRVLPSFEVRQC